MKRKERITRGLTMGVLLVGAAVLSSCVTAKDLTTIARQNSSNIEELSKNTEASLALLNAYFKGVSAGAKYTHIGQTRSSMRLVMSFIAGTSLLPGSTWATLFTGNVKAAVVTARQAEGMTPEEKVELERRYGWVAKAILDPVALSPEKAWMALEELESLQAKYPSDPGAFLADAHPTLVAIDPSYVLLLKEIESAKTVLDALSDNLELQVGNAQSHSKSIQAYAKIRIDQKKAFRQILGNEETKSLLDGILNSAIGNNTMRREAIELIVGFPGRLTDASP